MEPGPKQAVAPVELRRYLPQCREDDAEPQPRSTAPKGSPVCREDFRRAAVEEAASIAAPARVPHWRTAGFAAVDASALPAPDGQPCQTIPECDPISRARRDRQDSPILCNKECPIGIPGLGPNRKRRVCAQFAIQQRFRSTIRWLCS